MRRKDRQRDEVFAYEVAKKCQYATLATTNPDGSPYAVPVSPVLVENSVYFHCAPEGKKLENIAHNPNVCLVCVGDVKTIPEQYTTAYESAIIFGKAAAVEDRDEKIEALKKLCEKYTPEHLHLFDNAIERSLHRTAVYKISIDQITGKQKKIYF